MIKKVLFVTLIIILIFMISIEKTKQQDEILIASSMPQSSGLKAWGDAVFTTTNSYFNYANDNNLIKDKKIVLKVLDDKYEPDLTYENINKLSKDYILAFYGIVGTPTNKRVLPILEDSGMVYFSPFSGAQFLRDKNLKNIINFRPSYKQELENLLNYIVDEKKLDKIAIFYQNDEYGEEGYISTLEILKNKNIKLISTGTYKRNTLSINHAFNEIKKSKPEVIVMIGAYKANSLFIKKAKNDEILKNVIFCNISFGDANSIVKELEATNTDTKNLIFSQIVPNYNDKSLKIVQEYQKIMKKYSNESSLGFISFEAFLASKVLVNQISKIAELGELNIKNRLNALKSTPKNILNNLKFSYKANFLIFIIAGGMFTIIILSQLSIFILKNDFDTLFEKRTKTLIKLENINDSYKINIQNTLSEFEKNNLNYEQTLEVLKIANEIIDKNWSEYKNNSYSTKTDFVINYIQKHFSNKNYYKNELIKNLNIQNVDDKMNKILHYLNNIKEKNDKEYFTNLNFEIDAILIYLGSLVNYDLNLAINEKRDTDNIFHLITIFSFISIFLVVLFTIILSLFITVHFRRIHDLQEKIVEDKTTELKELNANLELKISQEVSKNRKKDIIMFQQARFASLGEMLNNIAHQWRQPLGSLSMIIQSFQTKMRLNKLSLDFIKQKVADALLLAQNMSNTLDDFKNI